jgi:hypothetical protein
MRRVIGPKYIAAATAVTTNQATAICQPGYQPAIFSSRWHNTTNSRHRTELRLTINLFQIARPCRGAFTAGRNCARNQARHPPPWPISCTVRCWPQGRAGRDRSHGAAGAASASARCGPGADRPVASRVQAGGCVAERRGHFLIADNPGIRE